MFISTAHNRKYLVATQMFTNKGTDKYIVDYHTAVKMNRNSYIKQYRWILVTLCPE